MGILSKAVEVMESKLEIAVDYIESQSKLTRQMLEGKLSQIAYLNQLATMQENTLKRLNALNSGKP